MSDYWVECRNCGEPFDSVGEAYCASCSGGIVPPELQTYLRWDARHGRETALIIAEFKLTPSRDRELIRQLAFARVAQGREA